MAIIQKRVVDALIFCILLTLLPVLQGSDLKLSRDIPYVEQPHSRQVLDVHAPSGADRKSVV